MNRKTVFNIFLFSIVIAILLATMIIADYNYVLHNQKPIFCFIKNTYDEEEIIEYVGFGYKIIDYKELHQIKLGSIFKNI